MTNRNPDEANIALECLKLASARNDSARQVIADARAYFNFVTDQEPTLR